MRTTYGILTDNKLIQSFSEIEINTEAINAFSEIADLGRRFGLRQLFILPESSLWRRIKTRPGSFYAQSRHNFTLKPDREGIWTNKKTGESHASVQTLLTGWDERGRVQLVMPGIYQPRPDSPAVEYWALDHITDASRLRDVIDTLAALLGVQPSIPNRTGMLLADLSIPEKYKAPTFQTFEPFINHPQKDLVYLRKLKPAEKKLKYLHVYDKNHAYLSAAENLKLGVGKYQEINSVENKIETPLFFDSNKSGLWQAHELIHSENKRLKIPGGWYYTPELFFYEQQGYFIRIKSAYLFSDKFAVFNNFSKVIRRALSKLKTDEELNPEIRKICTSAIKSIYTSFFGWLGRVEVKNQKLYNPAWRYLIISETVARIKFNVAEIEKLTGSTPIAVLTDALWYLSDEPDAEKAFPYPLTGDNPKTGNKSAYKIKYSLPAKEMLALINEGRPLAYLNDYLKRKNK